MDLFKSKPTRFDLPNMRILLECPQSLFIVVAETRHISGLPQVDSITFVERQGYCHDIFLGSIIPYIVLCLLDIKVFYAGI